MVYQQLKRKLLQNEGKPLYYLSYVVFKHETIIFSIATINCEVHSVQNESNFTL